MMVDDNTYIYICVYVQTEWKSRSPTSVWSSRRRSLMLLPNPFELNVCMDDDSDVDVDDSDVDSDVDDDDDDIHSHTHTHTHEHTHTDIPFCVDEHVRFKGRSNEANIFVLSDPSGNYIEVVCRLNPDQHS